jgi:hypothetical protein
MTEKVVKRFSGVRLAKSGWMVYKVRHPAPP